MSPVEAAEPPMVDPVEAANTRTVEALVSYFMVILTADWVLSPIREFCVRAGADPWLATLSQSVASLLLLTYAAGWVVRTFSVPPSVLSRLVVGVGAVVLFLASEAAVILLMLGYRPREMVAAVASPEGAVIGATMLIAAFLPCLRDRNAER